jgi:hypothetical protein
MLSRTDELVATSYTPTYTTSLAAPAMGYLMVLLEAGVVVKSTSG